MNTCINCGHRAPKKSVERLPFNDVALVEGVVYACERCSVRYGGFPRAEDLSRAVAHHLAKSEERLTPEEIRFLRKYLGYSRKDFAAFLDVAPETVSRWESKKNPVQMVLATEKLLRLLVLNDNPIADYGLEKAGSRQHGRRRPLFQHDHGAWRAA
jgi:DNA-binding transcriptional regulator YiaG